MKENILLVDDEEGIRKVLGISLADSGYNVFTAENGEEALRIFREKLPEIVLTDIKMPGMDGIDVLRKIKDEAPDTEVIVITGHGDMELAIRSLRYEATDFITKPIDESHLENALQKCRERILFNQKLKEYTRNLEGLIREKSEKLAAITQSASSDTSQQYQHLFDETPSYMAVIDRDFNITAANRVIRKDFGEAIGEPCYTCLRQRKSPCSTCPAADTFVNGEPHQAEIQMTAKDGTLHNMLVWTSALRDDSEHITGAMLMFARMNQLLEFQDHLSSLGLMIGSVSHSIKGLLTNLDGGVYLLESGHTRNDSGKIKEGLEIVKLMVSRIKNMVLDILYYAKEREPVMETVDISAFANEVADVAEPKMKSKGIEFIKEIDASAVTFQADPNQLRAALVNILENAVDACIEDKSEQLHKITFCVRITHEDMIFDICDNGIGMSEETKKKIFTLFFSSKASQGTGMGLFITEKIIRQHHGEITVESAPGQGTCFSVKIPRGIERMLHAADSRVESASD